MDRHLKEIVRILEEEKGVFQKILSLEEAKTGAIVNQDGKLLGKISRDQEACLAVVSSLETERMNRLAGYNKSKYPGQENISMHKIAAAAGADGRRILAAGKDLRRVLAKIETLQATNSTLINDNMEFYNILLSGLRRGHPAESGYGSDGREEEKVAQAMLFNQTA